MKIVFRVDASIPIGSGHVMRCLALADEAKRRGAETLFICRELPHSLRQNLIEKKHSVQILALDSTSTPGESVQKKDAYATAAVLTGCPPPDWIVVDHYQLDIEWEIIVRQSCKYILVIDDLADRTHDCDLLVDQNFSADNSRYKSLVPPNTRILLGPAYALLRPEFALARRQTRLRTGVVNRVFVCFGGTDPANHTAAALKALEPHYHKLEKIDVIIGTANPHLEKIRALCRKQKIICLHAPAKDIPSLLVSADLAIGAGGTMHWERACLGVPTLAFGIADNQKKGIEALSEAGYLFGVAEMLTPNQGLMSAWMKAVLTNPSLLVGIAKRSYSLVDGMGVSRVLSELQPPPLSFRPVSETDSEDLLRWRSRPAIRAVSIDPREIDPETHRTWLQKTLANPNCLLLIAESKKQAIGVIRFDIRISEATISVYRTPLQPENRYKLIHQATAWLHQNHPEIHRILAEVHPDNFTSLAAFKAAGYRQAKQLLAIELEQP